MCNLGITVRGLEQQLELAKRLLEEKINNFFAGKSIASIKEMIQHEDQESLIWLLDTGIENELYEISAAVQQVMKEREQQLIAISPDLKVIQVGVK